MIMVLVGSDVGKILVFIDFEHEYLVGSLDEVDFVFDDEGVVWCYFGISR